MANQRQPLGQARTSLISWFPVSAAEADTCGSTSTLSAETTASGSHVLTVADYLRDKELDAAGWPLQSDTFTAGGCSWRITYDHDNTDWICFGLCLQTPDAGANVDDAVVRTRYCLLDQAGQPVLSSIRNESERALSTMRSMRYTKFMKGKRFESYYLKDNRFSVRCDVTLVRRTCRLSEVMPPPDLCRHLGKLLASGVGADMTFEVGDEVFAAHRSVLAARSPVFKAELFGEPQHKEDAAATTMHVRIHDIEPSVFRALLHFIYTDSLLEIDAGDEMVMARRLLVAAKRYELDRLKRICEDVHIMSSESCKALVCMQRLASDQLKT